MSIFATKPIDLIKTEASATGAHSLKRVLTALDLTTLGIGAIIGTGTPVQLLWRRVGVPTQSTEDPWQADS